MVILRIYWHLICILAVGLFFTACSQAQIIPAATPTPLPEPHIRVIATGLQGPIGLAVLPDGGLLVAEAGTGRKDDSAGVTLITPAGTKGRLVSGLPSSRDSGDLAGVNLVALAPAGDKIYLGNFGQGHLWTLPLGPAQQEQGLALPPVPLTTAQLTPAMLPLNNVRLTNPFDLAFDPAGVPVVTDASGNGVATQNPDGTTRFFHRFDPLPDLSTANERDTIEAVPTGISRIGAEYYVTLTGGCPYPKQSGQLVAIDQERHQRTVVANLDMPIDVAQGPDGVIWVLEFARFRPGASCFNGEGYQARTGRLSQLRPDGSLQVMIGRLNFPGAVLPLPDGSVYVSEVFSGRIIQIIFPE